MSLAEIENVTKAWPPISRAVRVPHTDAEYRELVELLDRVTDEVGENETHPLASLMDVLGVLIENYEDEHVAELVVGGHDLVPEHDRQLRAEEVLHHVKIGVADAAGEHAHDAFVLVPRRRSLALFELEG